MNGTRLLLALTLAAASFAWLDSQRDRVNEGNRQFKAGQYEEAITIYGEALVDDPESPLLNFNMGTANYKAGKLSEALASFGRVRTGEEDPDRQVRTAYNTGNVHYRLGAAAEAQQPQEALQQYASALVAYRRVLGIKPGDQNAKFNYEFVAKKIEDLKKKLEEQQQQEQKEKQPQEAEQEGERQEENEQQAEQQPSPEAGEEQPKPEDTAQQQPRDGGEEPQEEQHAQEGSAGAGEERAGNQEMSPQEAASLIDTARGDEMRPEEFVRQQQSAGVAEPVQDW
jgi:Ca-activated chloride channel family protein